MFRIKYHQDTKWDNRIHWFCPTCNFHECFMVVAPEKCDVCGGYLPDIERLLEHQTARAAYHFAERFKHDST